MKRKLGFLFLYTFSFLISTSQSFQNPILAGYYPDPSICRAGDDYYIVNSSFAYYPGLPLFHSKDLLNWRQIGYALDRPEQLNLDGAGVSRGLFAPAITYHDGNFYIVCTEVSKLGNFVITAKNPKGPWSNPVSLPQVNGIDPSIFFDTNGKAYIIFNSIPPNNISMHDGHRTIRMFEFDPVNLKVVGEEKLLINGGTDIAKKPVWIEGPHIIQKDGWYYLICAEGGTGYNHSEVVFRSRKLEEPFISYEKNPILTQRHLDPQRLNPITTAGHADFVEGKDGKWWGVFLACRPYEGDYFNTGRETFMAPVIWKNGWPEFDLGGNEIKYVYPINSIADTKREPFNGNYTFRDEFDNSKLSIRYQFLRTLRTQWYNLTDNPGKLSLQLRPETCAGKENPSFVGFHQPHLKGHVATSLSFAPKNPNEKAGLLLFQNEKTYYYLCKSVKDGKPVIELYKGEDLMVSTLIKGKISKDIDFKVEAKGDKYFFYYATQQNKWILLLNNADAKYLSTKSAGGFVGCVYAMYASSNGKPSDNMASYNWFEVKNDDDVYK
jgi:xylan 1,4-beta-xylosidase